MEFKFNVADGETVDRHAMIAYLNVDEYETPEWGAIGLRITDSSMEYDWSPESSKDILGNTFGTMKSPILSQGFDDWPFSGGDKAQEKIAQLAVVEQNARKLANMDMMIFHQWLTSKGNVALSFAERYSSSMVEVSSIGGEGGGNLVSSVNITYGGTRTVGNAALGSDGKISFVSEGEAE